MKLNSYLLNSTACGFGLATILLLGSPPLLAQVGSEASSEAAAKQFDTDNPNDLNNVFNGRDSSGTSVLNLLNRLQDLNFYTPSRAEQLEGIDGAAQEFHRKQQQRLQESSEVTPTAPNPTEE